MLLVQSRSWLLVCVERCSATKWKGSSTTRTGRRASVRAMLGKASSSTTGPARPVLTQRSSSGRSLESLLEPLVSESSSTRSLSSGLRSVRPSWLAEQLSVAWTHFDSSFLFKLNVDHLIWLRLFPQFVMELKFSEAAKGAKKELDVNIDDACPRCDGGGSEPGTRVSHCHYCNGTGMVSGSLRGQGGGLRLDWRQEQEQSLSQTLLSGFTSHSNLRQVSTKVLLTHQEQGTQQVCDWLASKVPLNVRLKFTQ